MSGLLCAWKADLSGRPVASTVSRGFPVPASWLWLICIVNDEFNVFGCVGMMVLCPVLQYYLDVRSDELFRGT